MSGFWDERLVQALGGGGWLSAAELAERVEATVGSYVDGGSFSVPLRRLCEEGVVERRKREGAIRFEYRLRAHSLARQRWRDSAGAGT